MMVVSAGGSNHLYLKTNFYCPRAVDVNKASEAVCALSECDPQPLYHVTVISFEIRLLKTFSALYLQISEKNCLLYISDISKYAGPSDLTGKNQAGPTMFSTYRSESPVKICSLLRSGNNFLLVSPSNSVFKSRSFLQ